MSSRFDFYLPNDDYTVPVSSQSTPTYTPAYNSAPTIRPYQPIEPIKKKRSIFSTFKGIFFAIPRVIRFIIILALFYSLWVMALAINPSLNTQPTPPISSVDPIDPEDVPNSQPNPDAFSEKPTPLEDDPHIHINNPAAQGTPEQTIPGYGSLFISSRDKSFDNLSAATYGPLLTNPRKPFVPTTNGTVPVKQGMRISIIKKITPENIDGYAHSYMIDTQDCTLGYVDTQARIGYTSAHCIPNTTDSTAPYPVIVDSVNDQGQQDKYIIGYVDTAPQTWRDTVADNIDTHSPQPLNLKSSQWDLALIHFTGTAFLDPNDDNPLTGDFIIDNPLETGTRICSFGATTQEVSCGTIDNTNGSTVYEAPIAVAQGDSGGPAWAVDEQGKPLGIIGLNSAFSYIIPSDQQYNASSVPTQGSRELITPLFARMYSTQAQIIKHDVKNETTAQLYEKQFRR